MSRPTNSDFSRKPSLSPRKPALQMASFNSFSDMSLGLLSYQPTAAAAEAEAMVMVVFGLGDSDRSVTQKISCSIPPIIMLPPKISKDTKISL